jgi:phosphoribosylanthranilate isomerase
MLIKICGVQDPDIASFAAKNGADFIGFIMTPGFRRSVSIDQAKKIAQATRENGAEAVAVFINAPSEEIEMLCRLACIDCVQAYHITTPLALDLKRFYINTPDMPLRPEKDFLLMESSKPGLGEKIDMNAFTPPTKRPWFIAGGLTPENVKDTIDRLRPDGVDVSSGIEENGSKSCALILKFIEEVKRDK